MFHLNDLITVKLIIMNESTDGVSSTLLSIHPTLAPPIRCLGPPLILDHF